MFGWGWRRWMVALAYGDPARAYFGLGPCGEIAYRMYREGKMELPKSDKETLRAELEILKKRIEEIQRLLKED